MNKEPLWVTRYNRHINNIPFSEVQKIGEDYWYYSIIQEATKTDEDRTCPWCSINPPGSINMYIHDTTDNTTLLYRPHDGDERNFKKGDVVIREQFSNTNFTTYHLSCMVLKLRLIQIEFEDGLNRLENIAQGELI